MSPGRKGNTMNKARKEMVAIPEVAWTHVRIECGKVARRFHLNEDDRAELESHIRCEVRMAMAEKCDPRKGKPYTFIQRIVRNQLCTWMAKETRRRDDFCALAEALAAQKAKKALCAPDGRNDSVDDTSYSAEDRWDRGEIEPEPVANGETPWDPSGYARHLRNLEVRETVAELEGRSRAICERILKGYSLRETCRRMRCGSKKFFLELWPACKRDFIAKAHELGKRFEDEM